MSKIIIMVIIINYLSPLACVECNMQYVPGWFGWLVS
jgi:hypothetical protein